MGGLAQLFQADRAEAGGRHGEALAGEEQGIAVVPGAQLQNCTGAGGPEHLGSVDGRFGRLLAAHAGVLAVCLLPMLALGFGRLPLVLRHADALLTHHPRQRWNPYLLSRRSRPPSP
ncbi:hypothetical protein [Streptomyces sp. NBC_01235]|uniref:hypothetical protein n=1 Tax=Streptomyces sp. NBC_01235 TaxID=2903788 RepID=UPI002E12956A|nr:hypothetical protein OG289_24730 [Streptomyces sp. NBC_01235]